MGTRSILVLGATGKTGSRLLPLLRQRDVHVRAASRRGPTRFDWHDPSTWEPALHGVDTVYLVDSHDDSASRLLAELSALAVTKGANRLVLLSYRDAKNVQGEALPAAERAVRESGGDWTILRPAWFSQNFSELPFMHNALRDGELVLSAGDGLEPFIDAEDIAAVAAATLTEDGHAGQTYELTGPRALSFGSVVEEIAAATGRELRYRAASEEELTAYALEHGESPGFAAAVNTLCGWIAEGRNAELDDGVQRVLGREPRDFGLYVAATAPTGAWSAPVRRAA